LSSPKSQTSLRLSWSTIVYPDGSRHTGDGASTAHRGG